MSERVEVVAGLAMLRTIERFALDVFTGERREALLAKLPLKGRAQDPGVSERSWKTSRVLVRSAIGLLSVAAGLAGQPSPAVAAAAATGGAVEIVVLHVRDDQGTVHIELCPAQSFLKKCAIVGEARARAGTTVVTIPNVPPGRYAAQAYHDRNHNGKADRNFIGLPTEDVGFSNDALTRLSPPKFAAAAFDHGVRPQRITFSMRSVP